ncbi:putative zinc-binding metallopeptidase [Mycobacterium basiliense]|nr:putative zinc-binding metallopeptidase [Mycobacterium basiliense]
MRDFHCPNCGQRLTFENSTCLSCGSPLGFSLDQMALLVIAEHHDGSEHAGAVPADHFRLCKNLHLAECNWLVSAQHPNGLCESCVLTVERPNDGDAVGLAEFARAEAAKRRLVAELSELKLPIVGRDEDPEGGLAFRLLSSAHENVVTGHENGFITLDLAEGDDVHREQLRVEMDEPYRTLLGHFRHEVGHYYFYRLIERATDDRADQAYLTTFRELFGDPDADYQEALDRHYRDGAPEGWQERFVSSYATMHPAEDWAETFAHYLHIRDALDTAAWCGLAPASATFDRPTLGPSAFPTIIDMWLPLSWSLNMVNRSMGHDDLYPFVLPTAVLNKMRFIHDVIHETTSDSRDSRDTGRPA